MTKTLTSVQDFQTSVTASADDSVNQQPIDKMLVELPKLAKGMPQRMFSI